MPLNPGQTLSSYEILAFLGEGAMGEVYRARDTLLGREVALKVLNQEMVSNEQALLRFEREARILASLNHPNIAGIHGIDEDGNVCFFVLELVPGENLADRIARGSVPRMEAFEIARQLAQGLAAAHVAGVVHRDLKPANVMLTPDGRTKVLDFGLAKRVTFEESSQPRKSANARNGSSGSLTSEGVLLGTVDYMSPEQSQGHGVDERTDVWAFGCVLFELLSGKKLFPAETVPAKIAAIAANEPDWSSLPAETPSSVRSLLAECLRKNVDLRTMTLSAAAEVMAQAANPNAPSSPDSIAVLPFVNNGEDSGDTYFSDGITEEIIAALGKLPGLQVAARTSSFSFRGRPDSISEIGCALGVSCVLEGSVRRVDNTVRVSVQLIDTKDGYQRWSDRFDCEVEGVLALQDSVARAVARSLQLELNPAQVVTHSPRRPGNLEAYDRFLQGRFFLDQRGSSLERASAAFRSALDLDSSFAAAHAGLAESLSLAGYYGSRRPSELMPQALAAAKRALELDPQLAEAHTALAWVSLMYEWDTESAAHSFREAIRCDPRSVQARLWYGGYVLTLLGKHYDEGIAMCREATKLDPLSGSAQGQLAVAQNFAGRWSEALGTIDAALEVDPNSYLLWFHRGLSQFNMGSFGEARENLERAVSLSSVNVWAKGLLGASYARDGDRRRAEAIQTELRNQQEQGYLSPICLAMTPAALGDPDQALSWFEHGLRERDGFLRATGPFRVFDPLRKIPRFVEIMGEVGL